MSAPAKVATPLKHLLARSVHVAAIVLFLLIVVAWVRSHFAGDALLLADRDPAAPTRFRHRGVQQGGGDIAFLCVTNLDASLHPAGPGWTHFEQPPEPVRQLIPILTVGIGGYGYFDNKINVTPPARLRGIVLPHGLIAAFAAIVPAITYFRRWRNLPARRLAAGLCPNCGYDLRASPQRCPECGHAAAPRVASS